MEDNYDILKEQNAIPKRIIAKMERFDNYCNGDNYKANRSVISKDVKTILYNNKPVN